MKKIRSAALIIVCMLAAAGHAFSEDVGLGIWRFPDSIPGTFYLATQGSIFVAAYSYQPYLGTMAQGMCQGTFSGNSLSGEWFELDGSGKAAAAGYVSITFDGSDGSLDMTFKDGDGEFLTRFTASQSRAGSQSDMSEFSSIKSRVEKAFSAVGKTR